MLDDRIVVKANAVMTGLRFYQRPVALNWMRRAIILAESQQAKHILTKYAADLRVDIERDLEDYRKVRTSSV